MLKFGILDFDTSHAVEFTKRLNHRDIDKDQWVDGGRVVIGCPGESKLSPERIPGFTEAMKKLEGPRFEKRADMIGKVDAMLMGPLMVVYITSGPGHSSRPAFRALWTSHLPAPFLLPASSWTWPRRRSCRSSRRHPCASLRNSSNTWPTPSTERYSAPPPGARPHCTSGTRAC